MKHRMRCPSCGSQMVERQSRYGPFLGCEAWPQCDVTHSLHSDGRPMGTPADRPTRQARTRLHERFDAVWKAVILSAWAQGYDKRRNEARAQMYTWLGGVMGLTEQECHIGHFTKEQCDIAERHIRAVTSADIKRWGAPYDWSPEVH